jgi:hypothetical protein
VSIKIYLDEVRRSQFKAICALENLSMNEVLLGLLEDWLEKHTLPNAEPITDRTPPPPDNGEASQTEPPKAKRGKGKEG